MAFLTFNFSRALGLIKIYSTELSMNAISSKENTGAVNNNNVNINTARVFEDFQINVKLKISALWIAVMFCYVYGDYIEIYVPGVIADAMTVKSSIETQLEFFAVALLMAMPSVMIFFTLVLKPKVNLNGCYLVCVEMANNANLSNQHHNSSLRRLVIFQSK